MSKRVFGFVKDDNTTESQGVHHQPIKSDIQGIGGWLLLLIVGLMIIGPLFGLIKISHDIRDAVEKYPQLVGISQWQNFKLATWIIFASSAAISFVAGYRLWKIHSRKSVRFAIIANWLEGPLQNVLYNISAVIIFDTHAGLEQMITKRVIISCIGAGTWTAYLLLSDRVKNTYKSAVR